MLVLARRLDEQIVIGESIFITIVGIKDGSVRLGIDAPQSVPVHRREIFDAILARDGRVTPGGPPSRERDVSRERDSDVSRERDKSPGQPAVSVTGRAGTPGGPLGGPPEVTQVPVMSSDWFVERRPFKRPVDGGPRAEGDRDRGTWGYPEGLNGGGK